MNKEEFEIELRKRLCGLPKDEIDERVNFYVEMIEDRVEDGKSEDEAIDDLGGVDTVVRQIASDTNLFSIVKEKIKPQKKPSAFVIAMLIIGFPLWFPLLMTGMVLLLVAYMLLWVLVIVTYSVEVAFIGSSVIMGIKLFYEIGNEGFNVGYLSLLLIGIGASILFLYVCYLATKLSFKITKNILISIKSKLIGGNNNEIHN